MSENIKNALLEFARLVVFSLPGVLIQVISGDPALSAGYGAIILGVLKSLDRSIHEDKTTDMKGLLPF